MNLEGGIRFYGAADLLHDDGAGIGSENADDELLARLVIPRTEKGSPWEALRMASMAPGSMVGTVVVSLMPHPVSAPSASGARHFGPAKPGPGGAWSAPLGRMRYLALLAVVAVIYVVLARHSPVTEVKEAMAQAEVQPLTQGGRDVAPAAK